jgi:hypothetical protein
MELVRENIKLSKPTKIIWAQPVQPTRPPDSGSWPRYLVTPEYARYHPEPRVHSEPMIHPSRGSHPSHRSSRAEGPSEPSIPPDSGSWPEYLVTPESARFKGHDTRYITRSCARSFSNNMSPIKDRAPKIGGHGTRNVRAPEATSSSTTDPLTNREQS